MSLISALVQQLLKVFVGGGGGGGAKRPPGWNRVKETWQFRNCHTYFIMKFFATFILFKR